VIFPTAGFSLEKVVDPTGAGDSFAGAMIGYLANKKTTKISEIKKAVVYGNVLGSFAVEKYGLDGLLKMKKEDIAKRFKSYEKMIQF
jgi:sugar/nucleoside kinase (ribokinase family)